MTALVAMEQVSKRFGRVTALSDVSLQLNPGDLFGFLGPNGAGKTTAIRIMVGLTVPSAGRAIVCGCPAGSMEARARLGYVPDAPALYDKLTGMEAIGFAADIHRVGAERNGRAAELVDYFRLGPVLNRLVQGYSRGMRQKLAIICALVHDPDVLFLDEPTVGLDPEGIVALRNLLQARSARGYGVFLSTHQMELAASLCNSFAVLHRGRLLATGSNTDICEAANADSLEMAFLTLTGGESSGYPTD